MKQTKYDVRIPIWGRYALEVLDRIQIKSTEPVEAFVTDTSDPLEPETRYVRKRNPDGNYLDWQQEDEPPRSFPGMLNVGTEEEAAEECRRLNRIVAGPYGGTSARDRLWVFCEGPDEGKWSVILVEDAIDKGFPYKWVA